MTYEDALKVMQEARLHAPALVSMYGAYHVCSRGRVLGSGLTFEAALRAAKLLPRKPLSAEDAILFANVGCDVIRGGKPVCVARSRNMAHRIANALNAYTPNKEGF